MMDVNGDGKADIVGFAPDGSIRVAISNGMSFAPSSQWLAKADINSSSGGYANHLRQLADVDGDGFPDVISSSNYGVSVAYSARATPPDLITGFPNGLGLTTTVNYSPLTRPEVYTKGSGAVYPQMDLISAMYVVSNVKTPNALGNNYTSSYYQYGGLRLDLTGRGMLGFGWQQMQQVDNNITQRTDFRQDWPYIGMTSQTAKMLPGAGNGGLLSMIVNSYDCYAYAKSAPLVGAPCSVTADNSYFPYVSLSAEANWDIGGDVFPVVNTTNAFDSFGNATQITVDTDGYKKITTNFYPNDAARSLGRVVRSTVVSTTPTTSTGPGGVTVVPFSFTPPAIGSRFDYNLRNEAIAAGWDGVKPLNATVIVGSGAVIGASSTSAIAFDTGSGFPAGSTITLTNNGTIAGAGGNGGNGDLGGPIDHAGSAGGTALRAQTPITIVNNGVIGGGGGGGAGSENTHDFISGSGGGGAGSIAGVGGTKYGLASGAAGSLTVGGAGVTQSAYMGGMAIGSKGGDLGLPGGGSLIFWGATFYTCCGIVSGGHTYPGGAAGAAVSGKGYINSGIGIIGDVRGAQN